MKKLIFSLLFLSLAGGIVTVLLGGFANAKLDASSEEAFEASIQAIDMELWDNESKEFRWALLFYIDGCGPGGKKADTAFFSPDCGLDPPDLVIVGGLGNRAEDESFSGSLHMRIGGLDGRAIDNLTAIDGLTGEQIIEKYREDLEHYLEKKSSEASDGLPEERNLEKFPDIDEQFRAFREQQEQFDREMQEKTREMQERLPDLGKEFREMQEKSREIEEQMDREWQEQSREIEEQIREMQEQFPDLDKKSREIEEQMDREWQEQSREIEEQIREMQEQFPDLDKTFR